MRVRAVTIAVLALLAHAQATRAADNLASSERLGARIGYVQTFDATDTYYGPGFFLDLHVGAMYLGDILDPELDDDITNTPGIESEMRTFYFSVGVLYGIPLGRSPYTITTSLAAGIYSVSVALAADFVADDLSDQYFGGNAGLGLMWRIGTSWVLELNCTAHYFNTDPGYADLYWVFTAGEGEDPLMIDATLGLAVDLR
jgi:hypothetical protein